MFGYFGNVSSYCKSVNSVSVYPSLYGAVFTRVLKVVRISFRVSCHLHHVFASNFDWFTGLCVLRD